MRRIGHASLPLPLESIAPPGAGPLLPIRAVRLALGLVAMLGLLAFWAGSAHAEGSATLYSVDKTCAANSSNGQCRANIEWRTNKTANNSIYRRTLLKVYVKAGETILTGSSAVGVGSGDILIYDDTKISGIVGNETLPGTALRDCVVDLPGKGFIGTRAQELAGPLPTSGGYTACTYSPIKTGFYDVVMYGTDGSNSGGDGGPTANIGQSGGNFTTAQGTSIAAWDVTVRDASNNVKPGRLFTDYLAMFTGNNARPVFFSVYPVTTDGYRYQTDLRGLDPNGFVVYGNSSGFYNSDGKTPLYHDVIGQDGQVSGAAGGVGFATPPFLSSLTRPTRRCSRPWASR